MNTLIIFGTEVGLSVIISLCIIFYLGKLLRTILVELCGTADRAGFWMGFTKLMFLFLPLMIVLLFSNSTDTEYIIPQIRNILSRVLIGELITLCIVGYVIWKSIRASTMGAWEKFIQSADIDIEKIKKEYQAGKKTEEAKS